MIEQGGVLGGRYRLDARIGGGGMGDVWRGEDLLLERTVALKVLPPALMDEPGFLVRFRHEAQVMATIRHPGVVEVYDFGSSEVTGGRVGYLVMEHIEGSSLDRILARHGRLPPARTMQLMAGVAETLHAAHAAGVIHRDVKPANLLVRPDSSVVLTDFGIARSAASTRLTAKGMVLGTATYCAPEQATGETLTPAADIYALGVVAYECVAGRLPFTGETPVEIAVKHVHEQPPPLPESVPEAVRHVIELAMAKNPARRWQSANALALAASTAARRPAAPVPAVTGEADAEERGPLDLSARRPVHARPPRLYQRLGLAVAAAVAAAVLGTAGAMVASNPAEPIGETQRVPLDVLPTERSGAQPSVTPSPERKDRSPAKDRRKGRDLPKGTPSFPELPTDPPKPSDRPTTPPPSPDPTEPTEPPSTPPPSPPPTEEPTESPVNPEPSDAPTVEAPGALR